MLGLTFLYLEHQRLSLLRVKNTFSLFKASKTISTTCKDYLFYLRHQILSLQRVKTTFSLFLHLKHQRLYILRFSLPFLHLEHLRLSLLRVKTTFTLFKASNTISTTC